MIETTKSSLGFEVPVRVYESPEEADRDAGKVGAFLNEGNNNLYYRGVAAEVREVIAETIERLTGVVRETVPVMRKVKAEDGTVSEKQATDKEGNPLSEYVLDEDDYVKQALAKSGKTAAEFAADIVSAIRAANNGEGVRVDIRQTPRKAAKPKALPDRFKVAAEKAIASGKVAQFAKDYKKLCGKEIAEGQLADVTVVGWALKEFVAAREAQILGN